jgi:hypothetical protein
MFTDFKDAGMVPGSVETVLSLVHHTIMIKPSKHNITPVVTLLFALH